MISNPTGKRVALYARVSTTRQADNDVSLPDQIAQAEAYCKAKGWVLVAQYVDAGASARDDNRPEFRRMLKEACVDPSPYDVVLVHSQSRFFRDSTGYHVNKHKLGKHGITLASITQNIGDGADGELMGSMIAAFDAHQSAETSKHVKRSMIENARQGFWNGAKPPMGYQTRVAELRGAKEKKVLEIEPKGAELVKLIFKLYEQGDGNSGPLGIKRIVEYLNTRDYKTPEGNAFHVSFVGSVLRKETYAGTHYFNRTDTKTKKEKPREEWVEMKVPAIISKAQFDRVQATLSKRSPKKTPPRQITSEVLLTGLARCESCGAKMMLRTGKGGAYRYYTCSAKALKGTCKAQNTKPVTVPMPKLDGLVTEAIADSLLTADRLRPLLREVMAKTRSAQTESRHTILMLKKEMRATDKKLGNLMDAIADGLVDDSHAFRAKLKEHQNRRSELIRLIAQEERKVSLPPQALSNAQIDRFGAALKQMLTDGPMAFRKAYLGLIVDEIIVSREQVTITGSKAALAAAAMHGQSASQEEVRTFEREWRT
ncbi:MAG: recombinase family protein, partial [Alphaproteobacteria bacterium]